LRREQLAQERGKKRGKGKGGGEGPENTTARPFQSLEKKGQKEYSLKKKENHGWERKQKQREKKKKEKKEVSREGGGTQGELVNMRERKRETFPRQLEEPNQEGRGGSTNQGHLKKRIHQPGKEKKGYKQLPTQKKQVEGGKKRGGRSPLRANGHKQDVFPLPDLGGKRKKKREGGLINLADKGEKERKGKGEASLASGQEKKKEANFLCRGKEEREKGRGESGN